LERRRECTAGIAVLSAAVFLTILIIGLLWMRIADRRIGEAAERVVLVYEEAEGNGHG